jgi:hypothetical protein
MDPPLVRHHHKAPVSVPGLFYSTYIESHSPPFVNAGVRFGGISTKVLPFFAFCGMIN